MTKDDELSAYLEFLLEHRTECDLDSCRSCLMLQGILESMEFKLFSGALYPHVMLPARIAAVSRPHASAGQAAWDQGT